MKVVFSALCAILLSVPAVFAEEHSASRKPGVSTEAIYSEPYKRASISVDLKNWVLTPGYISSEDRRFGFVLGGYRFKRELEHGGEIFAEPHVGFASGNSLGQTVVLGSRVELESRKWIVASWVDTYRGGKVNFATCEPLAEVSRHIGNGFFFGATSSCYIGPGNEAKEEHAGHEPATAVHAPTEYLYFAGPVVSFRRGRFLGGVSYEVGKHNERFLAGYVSIRWR